MIAWFLFYILRESNVHGSVRPSGKWTDPDDQIYGGLLKSSQRMSKPIRIPIKYQKGVFSDLELNLIKHALDDLRDSLNGCVQFFDIDIYKARYSSYVFIRREDSDGNYDPDCWSYVGQMSKFAAQTRFWTKSLRHSICKSVRLLESLKAFEFRQEMYW